MAEEKKPLKPENVEFGFQYLYVLRELQLKASDKTRLDSVADAATRMFLIGWGLTPDEVDEANRVFWSRLEKNELGSLQTALQNLKSRVGRNASDVNHFIVETCAVAAMDLNLSEGEVGFLNVLKDLFDLRQSDVMDLLERGYNTAVGLHFFGSEYAKANKA
ncbi:hypothetical protein FBQ81_17980 [Chloroflexi bacterium CFX6]|nr:hypothetical protein [Chloroflexi bacterium CFX6]